MRALRTTKDVIIRVLPYVKGRTLDLGAGIAKYKPILIKNATAYIACDAKKNENIETICDVANLIFPPESFDTVVSTQVFEHINNPFVVAGEIKKVLKTGGHAIITAPFMAPFHPDPKDNFRFSKEGLEEIFKSFDFEIVDSGTYGGFFMVLSEMVHFSWFNPYKHESGRFMAVIEKIAKICDKIFPSKIIYANVFVVARKKMIFQPDRYLLKKQIKKYAYYIKGIVLDAGGGNGDRYKSFFKFEKYLTLDINPSINPDIIGSVENIPLDGNSIDSVISTQVLEHVKNPQKAVEEFYRVLKIGGYCLLTAPQSSESHDEPNDYFRFTKFGLEELFKKSGFKIILIEQRGGFWSANAQMQIRYAIDLFRLNEIHLLRWIFQPFIWLYGILAILLDSFDKSRVGRKHAIGWLIIAQK